MKAFSWLATGVALLGLLVGTAHSAPPVPQARWTIMVYMSGDNNLEDYIVKDIEEELGVAGSDANVKIVALADRGPGTTRVVATGRRRNSTTPRKASLRTQRTR